MGQKYPAYWLVGYYQKSSYLRNYLKSALLVYFVIIAAGLLMVVLDDKKSEIYFEGEGSQYTSSQESQYQSSTINPLTIRREYKKELNGYYGKRIKVVSDYNLPTPTFSQIRPAVSYQYDFIEPTFGDNFGSGVSGGGNAEPFFDYDNDYGLPPDKPFMPEVRHQQFDYTRSYDINFDGYKPAFIKLRPPNWPLLAKESDTGFVQIMLKIDRRGTIDWELIYEIPENRGFATEAINALIRSKYYPAELDDEKINSYIVVQFFMCKHCPLSLELSGNIEGTVKIQTAF